jgi:hypothetical protein
MLPPGAIAGPSAWYGRDLEKQTDWIHELSHAERDEIAAAVARNRGRDLVDVTREDFALPALASALARFRHDLLHGRGFVLVRGLPIEGGSRADAALAYWGLGMHLGRARSQNGAGHLLGHVRDVGRDATDPNTRIYQTNKRQNYHTDSVDIVALLCVQKAREGGLSALVSSVTVFNEFRARRPALLPAMFEPFPTDRRGEVPAGMAPFFSIPIFNWHEGRLTTMYVRRYIESSQRFPEAPRLTPAQIEGMDLIDTILEEDGIALHMDFEPGDVQLVHNHQILHDRTEFVDWPEPERRRHLLRLWLCPPDGRPLPSYFVPRYGSVTIGDRGGIVVPGAKLHAPLDG